MAQHAATVDLEDHIAQAVEEFAVVAHHHQRTCEGGQHLFQRGARRQIQVVGRFVHRQPTRLAQHQLRQAQARAFTARQACDRRVELDTAEEELREVIADLLIFQLRVRAPHLVVRRAIFTQRARVLIVEAHCGLVAQSDFAFERCHAAREDLHQRRLARTVAAYDADALGARDAEGRIAEGHFARIAAGKIACFEHGLAATFRCGRLDHRLAHVVEGLGYAHQGFELLLPAFGFRDAV